MEWKMSEDSQDRQAVIGISTGADCVEAFCDGFAPVVFSVAFKFSNRLDDAHTCVEPVLKRLGRRLSEGSLAPERFERELIQETQDWCEARHQLETGRDDDEDVETGAEDREGLTSFALLPRIARRRSLTAVLATLEFSDLLLVLLRLGERPMEVDRIAALTDRPVSQLMERLVEVEAALRNALAEQGAES